jgi:predicted transport protein
MMQTVLYRSGLRYTEKEFRKEKEFENLLINNSKTLFGKDTLLIDAKKKIDSKFMGGVIPDCFLFDFSDPGNPEFYIVEVELSHHSFYNHIFPQVTKFFAFFKNPTSQSELIEKLHAIIVADKAIKKEFQSKIQTRELFKTIKDIIENSQNILLVIDGEKQELPEIIETYTDTWGKMVKVAILKEFTYNNDSILTISPDFENIETVDISSNETKSDVPSQYTEAYHLDGVQPKVKEMYDYFRVNLLKEIPGIIFNPQRYYISLKKKKNIAYTYVRRKRIRIVVLKSFEETKELIKNYPVRELSESVQNYLNGPCCEITIESTSHFSEVIALLKGIKK